MKDNAMTEKEKIIERLINNGIVVGTYMAGKIADFIIEDRKINEVKKGVNK